MAIRNLSGVFGRKIIKKRPPVVVTPPAPPSDITIDNSINPPTYKLESNTAYPIRLNFLFDETIVQDTDTLEIQLSTDRSFGSLIGTVTRPLTSANTNAALPVYTDSVLTNIVSPTQAYIRARIRRGTSGSAWGKLIKHGDSTPATISSQAARSFPELQPVLHTLAANEFVTWTLSGGDAALLEIVNGNQVRLRNNAVPVFPTKASYATTVTATDDAGNKSEQQLTFTIISGDRIPKQFAFTALTGQEPASVVQSSPVTIEELGENVVQAGTVSGPVEYTKDNGATWSPAGAIMVTNGDTVRLRGTTGGFSTGFSGTLTINGISSTWNVGVKDNPVGVSIQSGPQPYSTNATDYSTAVSTYTITTEAGELHIWPGSNQFRAVVSITIDGQPMTMVENRNVPRFNGADEYHAHAKATVTAGAHTIAVTYNALLGNTWPLSWFTVTGHGTAAPFLFAKHAWADGSAGFGSNITIPTNGVAAVMFRHMHATNFTGLVAEKGRGQESLIGTQVADGEPTAAVASGGEPQWMVIIFPPA